MSPFTKRMEDKLEIPDMNGTLMELMKIISGNLVSHKHNADAIRSIAKVVIHTYLLEKKILEQLQDINNRGRKVNNLFLDKVLPQLVSYAVLGLLWILFQNFKP